MVARFRKWEEIELLTKKRNKKQLIIGITANKAEDYDNNIGFQEVVGKPIGYKELKNLISKYI